MILFAAQVLSAAMMFSAAASDSDSAVVAVRTYRGSPHVDVVAWSPDASQYGLRVSINQKGELVSVSERGLHTLYVSAPMVANNGGIRTASILPDTVLRHYGNRKDVENCRPTQGCSPFAFSRILLPDAILRSPRDSLVVTIQSDRTWPLVLPRTVIAAYLKTVDSVTSALKAKARH